MPAHLPTRLSFETLFREHFAPVYRHLRRWGLTAAEAEEEVQETFLVVRKKYDEVQQSGAWPLRDWLAYALETARNRARNFHRARRRRQAALEQLGHLTALQSPDPERQALRAFTLQQVFPLLSEVHQQVLVDHAIEDKTFSDMATERGCSVGSVHALYKEAEAEALRKLESRLPKWHPERARLAAILPFGIAGIFAPVDVPADVVAASMDRVWAKLEQPLDHGDGPGSSCHVPSARPAALRLSLLISCTPTLLACSLFGPPTHEIPPPRLAAGDPVEAAPNPAPSSIAAAVSEPVPQKASPSPAPKAPPVASKVVPGTASPRSTSSGLDFINDDARIIDAVWSMVQRPDDSPDIDAVLDRALAELAVHAKRFPQSPFAGARAHLKQVIEKRIQDRRTRSGAAPQRSAAR